MDAAARSAGEHGRLAFTLNLSSGVEAAARAARKGPLSYLQDRLAKSLKKELLGAIEFAFVIELTPGGRLHLHGIIDNSPGRRDGLERALVSAGGLWSKAHPERQLDLRDLWDGDGWSSYSNKDAALTMRILGIKHVLSMSAGMRRAAKDYWENLRRQQRARS